MHNFTNNFFDWIWTSNAKVTALWIGLLDCVRTLSSPWVVRGYGLNLQTVDAAGWEACNVPTIQNWSPGPEIDGVKREQMSEENMGIYFFLKYFKESKLAYVQFSLHFIQEQNKRNTIL